MDLQELCFGLESILENKYYYKHFFIISSAGVNNVFQTKDMEYVNVSLPWMSDHYAMVPQLVEKQLKTEQVCLYLLSLPLGFRFHLF